jgi:hypothetical protein
VNNFDILTLGNAVIVVVALYQLRICTLILAGNNMLVTMALGTIARYGPPASQSFVPVYVFSDENLATAFGIMAISLASLVGFTIVSARQHVRIGPDAPSVPRALLVAIAGYLVLYSGSMTTVLTDSYGGRVERYDLNLGGAHALICSLVVYELARRRLLFLITARKAFLIMIVIFTATGYARGGTGLTTGYLLTSACLMLPHAGASRRLRNLARVTVALLAVVTLSLMVRSVRATLHEEGTEAIRSFVDTAAGAEEARETQGEGLEAGANASQYAAHILECITMYDSGFSREWRSIYNVVEYTFKPSFLIGRLGGKRSIEAAWELADHFIQGGGIDVIGEFYWNGGFLCVVIMATALSFFCFIVDRKYRASPFWLMMLSQFAPSFLMGYGYGFAQVARGAINGLVVAGAYKVFSSLRERHATFPNVQTHQSGAAEVRP